MKFALKSLMAASVIAAGLGGTAASAMPVAAVAPQSALQAVANIDKTAFVCVGRCYRGFARRPFYRGYRAYRPYGAYRFHRFGYYR